jgi:hypothetical protein
MANTISDFKTNFNGGTRPNRFTVLPQWPAGIAPPLTDARFKIVSASLPSVTVNTISVPYRGRIVNFAGDRQYSPWIIGVYDDGNSQNLWRAFQTWKERLDGHWTHEVHQNDYSYRNLQTTWQIDHLDVNNNQVLRRIWLYKCWPSVVGEISLDMGQQEFVSFSVTLTYDNIKIQGM